MDALLARYEDVQARLRESSPRYAALTRPTPPDAAEIRARLLDADTTLLAFALGTPRSFLWAVTRDGLKSFVLSPREEIEAQTRALLERLSARPAAAGAAGDNEALAARLAETLLGPLGERPTRRLLIVPDGLLQVLPFAVLPWPGETEPLLARHEIVSLPSAGTLDLLRRTAAARPPAARSVVAVADPVFDAQDERVRGAARQARAVPSADATRAALATALGVDHLPRLPLTRREAEALRRAAPDATTLLGFDARREALLGSALADYRIVHLATHGLAHAEQPALSGVALSLVDERGEPQDGFLRLQDLYDLRLSADLVALSACQTAYGRDLRGEGVMSFARGFMHAGATRVLASLWQVHDEATAALMAAFYDALLRRGHNPAAALREAQLGLRQSRRWRDPYYWAAFTLQGEF
jgi:CHAT domain-containing protein